MFIELLLSQTPRCCQYPQGGAYLWDPVCTGDVFNILTHVFSVRELPACQMRIGSLV